MSPHPVPVSREVARAQAEILLKQVALGWGSAHEFVKMAATLAGRIKASNLAYDPSR